MTSPSERTELQQAIADLETRRVVLRDAVVDASITALGRQSVELDAVAPEEQRKLVTVLFADLAGWTQMASSMDPEDVQVIQQAYFRSVVRLAARDRSGLRTRGSTVVLIIDLHATPDPFVVSASALLEHSPEVEER